jgi:predicted signal transduction protein with EAL and GGDEF domain
LTRHGEADDEATGILNALVELFSFMRTPMEQHASVGIIIWDESSTHFREVSQRSDLVLHDAERSGKGYLVFHPDNYRKSVGPVALIQELPDTFCASEFVTNY